MQYAKDRRTDSIVEASSARRHKAFECPSCGARVFLRDGSAREAHFAHYSGEGSSDCEEYHPGLGGVLGPRAPLQHKAETSEESWTVVVSLNDRDWSLLLRLPEVPNEELATTPLSRLGAGQIEIYTGSVCVNRISALELRPGIGFTNSQVPPSLQGYRTQPNGNWPAGISTKRWIAAVPGLRVAGTVFRLRGGEWTRLREGGAVSWGEKLLVLAETNSPPPDLTTPDAAKRVAANGLSWCLWRITLPVHPEGAVEKWLDRIGYQAKASTWRIGLLSVPDAFNEEGAPEFECTKPLILKLSPPHPRATGIATLSSAGNRQTIGIQAAENSALHAEIVSATPVDACLEAIDQGIAGIEFSFVSDAKRSAALLPKLRVRIGTSTWEAWHPPQGRYAIRNDEVEIELGVEGARLDVISKLRSGNRRFRAQLAAADAAKEITNVLSEADSIEVDAGNFGRVVIAVGKAAAVSTQESGESRLTGWIGALAASGFARSQNDRIAYSVRGRAVGVATSSTSTRLGPLMRALARRADSRKIPR